MSGHSADEWLKKSKEETDSNTQLYYLLGYLAVTKNRLLHLYLKDGIVVGSWFKKQRDKALEKGDLEAAKACELLLGLSRAQRKRLFLSRRYVNCPRNYPSCGVNKYLCLCCREGHDDLRPSTIIYAVEPRYRSLTLRFCNHSLVIDSGGGEMINLLHTADLTGLTLSRLSTTTNDDGLPVCVVSTTGGEFLEATFNRGEITAERGPK